MVGGEGSSWRDFSLATFIIIIYSTKQMEIPSAFNCELGATFISFIVTFGNIWFMFSELLNRFQSYPPALLVHPPF